MEMIGEVGRELGMGWWEDEYKENKVNLEDK